VRRTHQILFVPSWGLLGRVLRMFPCLRQRASLAERMNPSKATRLDSQKRTKTGFGKFGLYWRKAADECFTFLAANSQYDVVIIHRALQDSADRLRSSFQALGPEGGFLSTKQARDVLVKTGLEKDQLRKIWNLSDIDRDGLFDHDEYGKIRTLTNCNDVRNFTC
jgi:hypothetical protein